MLGRIKVAILVKILASLLPKINFDTHLNTLTDYKTTASSWRKVLWSAGTRIQHTIHGTKVTLDIT